MTSEAQSDFKFLGIDLCQDYSRGEVANALAEPPNDEALSEMVQLGVGLSQRSVEASARFFRELVAVRPDNGVLWRNLGQCEKAIRDFKGGAEAFLRAFDCDARPADLLEAGICSLEVLLPEVAVGCAERALATEGLPGPEKAIGHFIVGRALVMSGRFNDAREHLLNALDEDPGLSPAGQYLLIAAANCADLAAVTNLIQQMDNAGWLNSDLIHSVLEALIKKSHFASVLDVFSYARDRLDLLPESFHLAIESARAMGRFELAYELTVTRKDKFPEFSNPGSLVGEIHTLGQLCKLDDKDSAIGHFENFIQRPDRPKLALNPWLLFSFSDDPALLLESGRGYAAEVLATPAKETEEPIGLAVAGHTGKQRSKRPVVAFYGCEFRNHPVADCLRPLLAFQDKQCDVAIFSNHFHSDSITEELKGYVETFVDCSKFDYSSTRNAIQELGVDILVDLSVHTAGGRPDFVSRRLAPVQVSYLGFSGTSGCPGYDFIISDAYITPFGEEDGYSERVLRLDSALLSMNLSSFREDRRASERKALGILEDEDTLLFGFLAQPYKLVKPVAEAIRDVISINPNVRLMLPERTFKTLADAFVALGVDRSKLVCSEFKKLRLDHLARLSACDLLLDSFPYNAHSLAADALSAGTPVLALSGRTFASRVSGSLMACLGQKEFISSSLEEYRILATELARDPGRLAIVRKEILAATMHRDYGAEYAADFYRNVLSAL